VFLLGSSAQMLQTAHPFNIRCLKLSFLHIPPPPENFTLPRHPLPEVYTQLLPTQYVSQRERSPKPPSPACLYSSISRSPLLLSFPPTCPSSPYLFFIHSHSPFLLDMLCCVSPLQETFFSPAVALCPTFSPPICSIPHLLRSIGAP